MEGDLPVGRVRFGRAPRCVGTAGVGPDVDAQLRVAGTQAPRGRERVVRGQLGAVRLAVLPVADHDGRRRWRVDLLDAAQSVIAAVEARQGEGKRPLPGTGTPLVSQVFLRMGSRTAGEKGRRPARSQTLPLQYLPES